MYIERDETGGIEALEHMLESMRTREDVASVMVLVCDENGFAPAQLDSLVRGFPKTLFGGVFPALLHGPTVLRRGCLVVGLQARTHVTVIEGMSDPGMDFEQAIEKKRARNDDVATLMVFLDGLSERVDAFIDGLYGMFGLEVNYVGGGAGSMCRRMPCVLSNRGVGRDCAVLVEMPQRSGVGVGHGLEELAGPFHVTESGDNVLKSLDWDSAMQVYRRYLEPMGVRFNDPEGEAEAFRNYPFGIIKLDAEMVVREPVRHLPDGGIVCVGQVPEGSYVNILRGEKSGMKCAAAHALETAVEQLCLKCVREDGDPRCGPGYCAEAAARGLWGFAVECVTRMDCMGETFKLELQRILPENVPMIGICSVGEVANNGMDYLEFYNKSCVVALLEGA